MDLGGLPYDEADIPVSQPPPAAVEQGDVDMLDRPLDDFIPKSSSSSNPRQRQPRPPPSDEAQSLMGRMGRSKVYLAEESPALIHLDGERRIRRDPHLAKLADELDKQDPTAWLDAISETAHSRIRHNALFVQSDNIKHLSTAKVFSWVSELGATAMGIEWLNDSSLIILFATPAAALLGLSMLAKAGFDPTEGDDPLLDRSAHGVPSSLLPLAEEDSQAGEELLGGNVGQESSNGDEPIRRRGRGTFSADSADRLARVPAGSAHGQFDLEPLAPAVSEIRFAEGVDPNARVTVRYATAADSDLRRQASQSEWYSRHGRQAGKEVVSRRSGGYGGYGRDEVSFADRIGTNGEGRDFARRIGRERRWDSRDRREDPYDRRDRPQRNVADLDADLDNMAAGRAAGEEMPRDRERERGHGRRGNGNGRSREYGDRERGSHRRERRNVEDLDKELDDLFSARAAADE